MAIRPAEKVSHPHGSAQCALYRWTGLLNGDSGAPVPLPVGADKSVQVSGTTSAATTLAIEGSNLPTSPVWATLSDPQGNTLTFTNSLRVESILENTYQVRPVVTAGDGATNLTVTLLAVRS